jgi:hypothetical protein
MLAAVIGMLGLSTTMTHASMPGAQLQASVSPTASVAYASIPAEGPAGTPGDSYGAFLVVPGPGVQTVGSDGRMSMAKPWGGISIWHFTGKSPNSTLVCDTTTNVSAYSIQPDLTWFDIDCGGTAYRVSLHSAQQWESNPSGPWYDGQQWTNSANSVLINMRWDSRHQPWMITTAQVCHGDGICTSLQQYTGSVGPTVAQFTAQEVAG